MSFNDYHFITYWRVKATQEEVFKILTDATKLIEWWPSVYLNVKVLKEGDHSGTGTKVELLTKGWLPYTLNWEFETVEVVYPERIMLIAEGDFKGRGIWTFEKDGEYTNIKYDWKISADKSLIKSLSFLLKPIFSANHKWAMDQGIKSLELELLKRRLESEEEKSKLPLPPQATNLSTKTKVISSSLFMLTLFIGIYKFFSKCKKK